jgi:hypothetical protein
MNVALDNYDTMLVVGDDGIPAASTPRPVEPSLDPAHVAPNPTPGSCRPVFAVPQAGMDSVVLFDVGGSRVRNLLIAWRTA